MSKCALACAGSPSTREALLADEAIATSASTSYVHYQPIGPVLAVMPWNFPLWQVIRFAAPALMVGNVGLLKHASNVPQTALAIEDLFRRAGLPEGVFTNLFVESKDVAADHRRPPRRRGDADRQRAGRHVGGEAAGHALKKSVLELGGSDPFIVLPSADLDACVRTAVTARVQNNGQSCIAAKRFIVVDEVHDEFLARFTEAMDALVVGDPFDPATDVGPIVTEAQRDELVGQVEEARRQGASVHAGAQVPDGDGWYFAPTVLSGITTDMEVAKEEVFGPVAMVLRVPDLDGRDRGGQRHHLRARLERVDQRRGRDRPAASRGSRPVRCSSTPWWPPRPSCPSAASSVRASAASSPSSAQGVLQRQDRLHRLGHHRDRGPCSDHLSRPRGDDAAAARGGGRHGGGPRPPTGRSATRPGATRRRSGPGGCSRRPATRSPRSWAATRARSSSPRAAPRRPTWPCSGRRGRVVRAGRGGRALLGGRAPGGARVARAAARAGADAARAAGGRQPACSMPTRWPGAVVAASRWWRSWRPTTRPAWSSRWPTSSTPCAGAPRRPYVFTDAVQAAPWLDLAELHRRRRPGVAERAQARRAGRRRRSRGRTRASRSAPRQHGGGQERERRSGTQDVAGAVGLATALRLVAAERRRRRRGWPRCATGSPTGCWRPSPGRTRTVPPGVAVLPGHLHLCLAGVEREELLVALGREGVCVSGGSSCASGALEPSHVLAAMGVEPELAAGALRFTLGSTRPRPTSTAPSAWCPASWPRCAGAAEHRWHTGPMRVLVAMSGGVDSSVAAALLVEQGHEVIGATLKLWGGPSDSGCCSVADVEDARRVAQQLGIDHHVFNLTEEFDRPVVAPYVDAHAGGRTPNPCIECNRSIKFDRCCAGPTASASTAWPPGTTPG